MSFVYHVQVRCDVCFLHTEPSRMCSSGEQAERLARRDGWRRLPADGSGRGRHVCAGCAAAAKREKETRT